MDRARVGDSSTGAEASAAAWMLTPGEHIGDLVVGGLIGRGGMSCVYEAEDVRLRRRVAVKVSTDPLEGSAEVVSEAQALAAVRHPGLPIVHALGSHHGITYMVMERIYGVSLEEDLDRLRRAGGQFPLDDALDVLIALADVLGHVHRAGMAHRDVKPANVMLCPHGRVVLLDFGIAVPEVIARDLRVCGTPRYMAPELIAGHVEAGEAHMLDIYAFGAVACELLTGRPPFDAPTVIETLDRHLDGDLPDLAGDRPDLPAELVAIVLGCLARDLDDRPPSIEAVSWELRALAGRLRNQPATPLKVLIVDDDRDCAGLMRDCVRELISGAQVSTVDSCEAALALVRREPPSLMLVDLGMPGMSGVDLCLRLKAMPLAQGTEIVVVSGRIDGHSQQALRQAGVRHALLKGSALPERLCAVLRQVQRERRPHGRGAGHARPAGRE